MIEIRDLSNILIDGQNAGQLMDVLRNHPKLASDVQVAAAAWDAKRTADHAQAITDAQTTAREEREAALAELATQHEAAIGKIQQEGAELQSQLKDAQSLIDALGGTELGQKMAKEKHIADARARKEAAEAELKGLESSDAIAAVAEAENALSI